MTQLIIGLLVTMVFSAFFSGMEIAFVSSNRLLAEVDRDKNGLSQKAICFFYRHPNNFVSTMLVGNNIALVIYGILFAQIFDATLFYSLNDGERVVADTLLSTIVVLFTGEFLPKTIFKSNPNTLLTFFAIPALVCYVTLYPLARLFTAMSRVFLQLMGMKIPDGQSDKGFTKVDLDHLVQTSIDSARDDDEIKDEVKIFHNALDFSDTKVRDCMVPRTEVVAVDIDECSVDDLKSRFIETGFSKILVYRDDIDHIIGYIHSSEMFRDASGWKKHIRTLSYVPETMAARKLMQIFMQQKKSISVVVDEFGGTSGVVTMEDLVEDIFGDIEDEHDNSNYVARKTDDGDYMLSARLEIEKVNGMFDLDLPESDGYMTVGGLILHEYQSFPKLNEIVKIGQFEFKIIKSSMTKIELVRLKVNK
ncbi:hemolysin family protein [Xylanibacter muris]|nr:hemolysin family protein [Xylanibacter muris]